MQSALLLHNMKVLGSTLHGDQEFAASGVLPVPVLVYTCKIGSTGFPELIIVVNVKVFFFLPPQVVMYNWLSRFFMFVLLLLTSM